MTMTQSELFMFLLVTIVMWIAGVRARLPIWR